jgi:hypothetical protein
MSPAATRTRTLPAPPALERTCKGLAALDAMLSPAWQDRYYSFNRAWDSGAGHRMASMRNGSGDEWFIVFGRDGVFVKAFWHEHPPQDAAVVYAGLPSKLAPQLKEPAFSMQHVTFGGWHDGISWTLRGNAEPLAEELDRLTGDPGAYQDYAKDYFELDIPTEAIAHVLLGEKLDALLLERVAPGRTLAELNDDLDEIGY